jgi:hypothetical protein
MEHMHRPCIRLLMLIVPCYYVRLYQQQPHLLACPLLETSMLDILLF